MGVDVHHPENPGTVLEEQRVAVNKGIVTSVERGLVAIEWSEER